MESAERVPLSRLARLCGLPEATVRGWKRHGLLADERNRMSVAELLAFCESHAHLRAADEALPRLRDAAAALAQDRNKPQRPRPSAVPSGATEDSHGDTAARQARGAARAARAAAREHLLALLAAARAAETVAREHRHQIERLVSAYQLIDETLVDVTGPVDLRDLRG